MTVSGEQQRDLAIHIHGSQVIFLKPCVLPPSSSHYLDCFDSQSSHWRSLFENNQPLANKPVHPKGNQSWIFIGRTDVEAETPILWPPDAKSWLIGKDPDGGKDWGQEEKGMTEDQTVGWHHWLNRHEFEYDGQGALGCCSPWGCKELDMTDWLNWIEQITFLLYPYFSFFFYTDSVFVHLFISKKFYWCAVDLPYCVSFRCTAKWINQIYIHISTLFKIFFSHTAHYRVLSGIFCVTQ